MADIKDLRNYCNYRTGTNVDTNGNTIAPENQANVAPKDGQSRNYTLKDICYAPGFPNDNESTKVPKMVIMEYQPQYPIYTASLFNIAADLTTGVKALAGKYLGQVGLSGGEFVAQAAGKMYANNMVEQASKNPSAYYQSGSNISTVDQFFKLFRADALGTYEVPFFTEYAWEANGIKGWQTGSSKKDIGDKLSSMLAENMNVNWPTTPDWEYDPQYPDVEFKFHLINDTSAHLKNNIQFLVALTSGMKYVQLGNIFKSPNIYDIYVPGRFRWYWSAMSINVKFLGKIFYDDQVTKDLSQLKAFGGDASGFPEVFEVSMEVKSLLPNNFNLYIYYLVNGSGQRPVNSQTAGQEFAEKMKNALNITKASDTFVSGAQAIGKTVGDFGSTPGPARIRP